MFRAQSARDDVELLGEHASLVMVPIEELMEVCDERATIRVPRGDIGVTSDLLG